jgi:hypothetical protein
MKPYHKRFRHLDRRTVQATKTLLHGWAAKTDDERWVAMRRWLDEATNIYRTIPLVLELGDDDCYLPGQGLIVMSKPSIITLLHEYRHHFQYTLMNLRWEMLEDDARAWSLSLYYATAPRTLRSLARNNRVFHLTPTMESRETQWAN